MVRAGTLSSARRLCVLTLLAVGACRAPAGSTDASATRAHALRAPGQEPANSTPAHTQPAPALPTGFAGVWHSSFGSMRLAQDGARVHGTYSYSPGATIEGELDGRLLGGTYFEPDGAGGGTRGRLLFELAEDGASFRGRWRPDAQRALTLDDRDAQPWRGTRVAPVAGRVWLVILEAHWEQALDEHEYSYGDMLRAFFERVPSVEVRHRYFNDRADLVRLCGELSGLVEPVVLYISSHGSRAGLAVGGETIDAATLGAALRDAGELRLLHLGSCEVMAGDAAAQIRAAAAPHEPFPISGFKVAVDWAGSAIVDFTYLDLVLEGGLEPAKAVEATRAMLTFAGPPKPDGQPISGTDLVLSPTQE